MSVNKNVSVCVAISPRLLIKIDANRLSQKPLASSTEQRKHHTSAGRTTRRRRPLAPRRQPIAELFRLPIEAIFSLKPMTPLSEEIFREPPAETR